MTIEHAPDTVAIATKAAVAVERTGIGIATTTGAAQLLGLTPDQWAIVGVIAGVVIGAFGLVGKLWIEWHFRSQALKLEQRKAGLSTEPGGLK